MPSNGTLGGIRTHDPCLRRPRAISRVYKMGINPKTVAERLGHSSVVITRDTYSHLTPGMQEAAAVQYHPDTSLCRANDSVCGYRPAPGCRHPDLRTHDYTNSQTYISSGSRKGQGEIN